MPNPSPFAHRRIATTVWMGGVGNVTRQDVHCNLCPEVGRNLPVGNFSEQWALGHLETRHAGDETVARILLAGPKPAFTLTPKA